MIFRAVTSLIPLILYFVLVYNHKWAIVCVFYGPGVAMAVTEFSERVGRQVFFTNRVDLNQDSEPITTYKSWYMIK